MAVYNQVVFAFLTKYGMGRHYEYILPTMPNFIETFVIGEIGFHIAIGLLRISICKFVLRLTQGTHPRTRIALYITLSLNGAVTLAAVFIIGFQCQPLRKTWNPMIEGTCINHQIFTNIMSVVGGMLPHPK